MGGCAGVGGRGFVQAWLVRRNIKGPNYGYISDSHLEIHFCFKGVSINLKTSEELKI
jgi:hypothetical protein